MDPRSRRRRWPGALALAVAVAAAGRARSAEVQRYQLDNGLTVLLYPLDGTHDVALLTLFDIGDEHDPPGKSGLSHLLEHLYITCGTKLGPSQSARDFQQLYPAGSNAQTGSDYTVFAGVFNKSRLKWEIEDAGARMSDLRITKYNLEPERSRLLDELENMYGGVPQLAAVNTARSRVRPPKGAFRRGGVPEQIDKITVSDLREWWTRYYKPTNATVVVAGSFDPATVRDLIQTNYGDTPSGEKPPPRRQIDKPRVGQIETIQVEPTIHSAQPQACIAFSAPAPASEHYAATLVLVSRMWGAAAKSGGQAQVFFAVLDDPTLIAIASPIKSGENPKAAAKRLRDFVDDAVNRPLTPTDVSLTKSNVGILLGLADFPEMMIRNNLYGVAFSIGRRAQMGLDPAKLRAQLDSVSTESLDAASREVFGPDRQAAVMAELEQP